MKFERRNGRQSCSYVWYCSSCGEKLYYINGANAKQIKEPNECEYFFCPWCGEAIDEIQGSNYTIPITEEKKKFIYDEFSCELSESLIWETVADACIDKIDLNDASDEIVNYACETLKEVLEKVTRKVEE